jgi:hypothetical protein
MKKLTLPADDELAEALEHRSTESTEGLHDHR